MLGRVAGTIWKGLKAGAKASKAGQSIDDLLQAIPIDGLPDAAAGSSAIILHGSKFAKPSNTELLENAAARLGNMVSGPEVVNAMTGTGVGIALGSNPVVALASTVGGNMVGKRVGNFVRSKRGQDSVAAGLAQNFADIGTSIVGGNLLTGIIAGGEVEPPVPPPAQRYLPSQGSRQFADMATQGQSMQSMPRPEGRPMMADRSMVQIPMLDAATADKLRKRAIENAQKEMFMADELTSLMGEIR